jgi:O-antigen ligase
METEILPGEKYWKVTGIQAKAAGILLRLSYASLGVMIVLIPFRYRWVLQDRPHPPVYPDFTNLFLVAAELPLLVTLALWLASLGLRPRRISLHPHALSYPLAALVGVATLSFLSSADPALSLYHAGKMLLLFGLYLYLINEIHSLWLLIAPAGMQILLQSVVAVAQVLRQHSIGLSTLQELSLDPTVKGISIVWTGGVRTLRAYGLTSHPNLLGGCLALALIFLAAGVLQSRTHWRLCFGGLFGLGTLALLLTFSRAAWLGLLAGLTCISIWAIAWRKKDAILKLTGLYGGTFILLLPFLWSAAPLLASRVNLDGSFHSPTPENQSIHERMILFGQAWTILLRHPLAGTGLGAFPEALQQAVPDNPFDYQPPHMVLMEVAAETGFPGGVIYLGILVIPWALLFQSRKKLGYSPVFSPGLSLEFVAASGALLAITIISFLDYYPWLSNQGRMWQWLIWGVWASFYQTSMVGKTNG